jgi:hypothetical protein
LSAGLMAFDYQRLEVGASAIESGGVTRTAGPDDHNIAYVHKNKKPSRPYYTPAVPALPPALIINRFRKTEFASDGKFEPAGMHTASQQP